MDNLTSEQRRKNMQRIRSKDTKAELQLRKALYHKGYRYRKNWKALPGHPDIALTKQKIAIFCDGEFFHGKDFDKKKPVDHNHDYWDAKIRRNMDRDLEVTRQLRAMGWTVIRFWDSEVTKTLDNCVKAIEELIFEQELWRSGKEIL